MSDTRPASPDGTRTIVVEQEVEASPEAAWDALTTAEGLRRWFPLEARVEPGEGGSVWLSWGPGVEGEAPIHVWERPRRFGWTESHGADAVGRPIEIAVDFHIEGRAGSTVVRLVQSGLSAAAEWDEMYDALVDGWTYFLFNLAFYLAKHAGRDRSMVWRRVAVELGREAIWERLLAASLVAAGTGTPGETQLTIDEPRPARIASTREGFHFAASLPDLDDSLFFVEVEGAHVGFWLSTYRLGPERVEELQQALDTRLEDALSA